MTAALSEVETTAPEPAEQVLSVRYAGRTVRATVVPGHDGRMRRESPAAPGPAGRVAVVLG